MRQAGIAALSGRPYGELSMDQDDAAGTYRPRYIELNARDTRCRKRAQKGVG